LQFGTVASRFQCHESIAYVCLGLQDRVVVQHGRLGGFVGRHSKIRTRRWVTSARAATLAGALGAGVLGTFLGPLSGPAAASAATPAPSRPAPSATAPAGATSKLVPGTPCTATAKACVDLAHNEAWLLKAGHVVRGPVQINKGAPGKNTPSGTFNVLWKDLHHRSKEYNNAPMEYSVFFTTGGVAFHEGDVHKKSAGCVHLSATNAAAWYSNLSVGDQVQVH
jgi:L,D-transpeptidase catalytic domain